MKRLKEYLKENEEKWLGTTNPERLWDDHSNDALHSSKAYQRLREDKEALHPKHELTEHEKTVLDHYTGSLHFNMNRHHRGQELKSYKGDLDKSLWHIPEYLNNKSKHLDSAIDKHVTQHPAHVWRGMKAAVMDELNLKPGQEFHDKGYVSTTLRPATARDFGGTAMRKEVHVMRIKLPKGSKGMSVDNYPEVNPLNEHEVILPRNSKFRYEGSTIHEPPPRSDGQSVNTYHIHHVTHLGVHHD
jgi:hypothetical protein